ncbi:hypothetical protein EV44_g0500 [Erysiphe necator]|uniref:Uncharacterized protein n=1 Tax=Uncinula necator TaxID=52586 RepID=A0A0B1PFY1_UNCNE|nr:hypothetical protein EV44_g0500 [Erysiphe necator]
MFLYRLIFFIFLINSSISYPSQKRDTISIYSSIPTQNVIHIEKNFFSKPINSLPRILAISYDNLKQFVNKSINFYKLQSNPSVTLDSSLLVSSRHKKIIVGGLPSNLAHLEHSRAKSFLLKFLKFNEPSLKNVKAIDNGSMNDKSITHQTSSIKSIHVSVNNVPSIYKRGLNLKFPKWDFKSWRGWNWRLGTPRRIGGGTPNIQSVPSTPSTPNLQSTLGTQSVQENRMRRPNFGAIKNYGRKAGSRFNNGRKARSRFKNGVNVGRKRVVGPKGSRKKQKNKPQAVKDTSPAEVSHISSDKSIDKSSVQNIPVPAASQKKKLKSPEFGFDDSQTERYSKNKNNRNRESFSLPSGLSDFSDPQSDAIPKTFKKVKTPQNTQLQDFKAENYYSSSDKEKSDSSSSVPRLKKGRARKAHSKKKNNSPPITSVTDPKSPETKPENSINKIPPPVSVLSFSDEQSSDTDSKDKINSIPDDNPVGNKIQNPNEVVRFKDVQFMNQESEFSDSDIEMSNFRDGKTGNFNRPSNPQSFMRHQTNDDMPMQNFHIGEGEDYGTSTGRAIGKAIGDFLPIAHTVGNIVTGKGNMGHGAGGYGGYGGYGGGVVDDFDGMGGMGGYGGGHGGGFGGMGGHGGGFGGMGGHGGGFGGMSGQGGGYGGSYGGGYNGGSYTNHFGGDASGHGALGLGGDSMHTPDLLDETRSPVLEKTKPKSISKKIPAKTEKGVGPEGVNQDDEMENQNKSDKASEKTAHSSKSKDTHDKISDINSSKLTVDSKKNDTMTVDNENSGDTNSSHDHVKTSNSPASSKLDD